MYLILLVLSNMVLLLPVENHVLPSQTFRNYLLLPLLVGNYSNSFARDELFSEWSISEKRSKNQH